MSCTHSVSHEATQGLMHLVPGDGSHTNLTSIQFISCSVDWTFFL